jgi:prevent-host-death family protein
MERAMHTVNIHEAKTHLSRLVEQAAGGEPFVIAKAGKPLVKVMALGAPAAGQTRRLGSCLPPPTTCSMIRRMS